MDKDSIQMLSMVGTFILSVIKTLFGPAIDAYWKRRETKAPMKSDGAV